MRFLRCVLPLLLSLLVLGPSLRAQRGGLADATGEVGLGLALRHLTNAGIFMETTGHPDDENSGLLVMLNRGQGYRTALATATRGSGGQNEIGPELSEALAVLRTEELAAVHRYDGAEQYFTRAIDFGYSFSVEETFEKWGKEEILSDYVRLIRTVRPDVILAMRPDGAGGGQHHQASARITGEAFRAAGDPNRFPEQLKEGLRPWQPRKLYYTESFGFRGEPPPTPGARLLPVNNEVYDPLLGETCVEIGGEARSNHKCQGMGQLLALPGPQVVRYRLVETTIPGEAEKEEKTLFDGVDSSVPALAQYAGAQAPDTLKEGLASIARQAEQAQKAFESQGVASAEAPVLAGLAAVRALRTALPGMGLSDTARYEIDFRLKTKEEEFENAAVLAQGLRIAVLADDGVIIRGQPVKTTLIVANRGGSDVQVERVSFAGFEDEAGCRADAVKGGGIYRCESAGRVPMDARYTTPYWKPLPDAARYEFEPDAPFGLPFRPTPFRVRLELGLNGGNVRLDLPVQYRYEGNIFSGEKHMELQVVPRLAVTMTPDIAITPSAAARVTGTDGQSSMPRGVPAGAGRELRVTVKNGSKGPATGQVTLDLPQGWRATPPSASVQFTREDEAQTVRFTVTPPVPAKPGHFTVRAKVQSDGDTFSDGYQVIEYPHIHRRQRIVPAETALEVIDVKVAPRLKIGYVMGVGDQVPPALEQLGAEVDMLDSDDLAWGDLSKYDAIVTGVRAYERRDDLRAHNQRLLDYVSKGGTLIAQYNKFEFNQAQYAPYPAKVSSGRVTDEISPVQVLVPSDPVFTFPNKIGESAWKGWVQERGLYFLGEKDPRYIDLVQLEDPFPYNKGIKRGALVEAQYGKGRWVYVGLGLWRQLPAGTDGAYQLMANLISLGRAPKGQQTVPPTKK
jgi:hypothetical protein